MCAGLEHLVTKTWIQGEPSASGGDSNVGVVACLCSWAVALVEGHHVCWGSVAYSRPAGLTTILEMYGFLEHM